MSRFLFESICCTDGAYGLLPVHQRRVDESWRRLSCAGAPPDLERLLSLCEAPSAGVYKCRFSYSTAGEVLPPVFSPYEPAKVTALYCVDAEGLDYSCKWEDREALNVLGRGMPEGGLPLVIQGGLVTDSLYANVVFGEPGRWVTPDTFLLRGVKRTALLEQGRISERKISQRDIREFPYCSLINAMLEPGQVMVPASRLFDGER